MMIKIKNNTATREALPQFLQGLLPVSLLDLSWTDPALNVQDCAWWPEENADVPIDADTQRYGAEVLTIDVVRQVVAVSHEIVTLTAEELAEKQAARDAQLAATEAARVAALWQAAHDYEYAEISGSAVGLLAMGVMQSLPKCVAVQNWIKGIWELYYLRKAGTSTDCDYSGCGACPFSVPELMAELGL